MRRVLLTATSYPRSEKDWQGIFIREMLAGLARSSDTNVSYWGPSGPVPDEVDYVASAKDAHYLQELADRGGIAHQLRSSPVAGMVSGLGLVRRLRRILKQKRGSVDVFHLNWLQSALSIPGRGSRALVTVLGTDYKLLDIPGVAALLRNRFSSNRIVLAPNAEWMVPKLQAAFGSQVEVVSCVPFGIDHRFYAIEQSPAQPIRRWITVLRLTRAKLGPLLEWARDLASEHDEFHLFGPMQEEISLPPWIHYHGPVTPDILIRDWYPRATAMITLSRHDEGRPQVLLEAMASGVPVIASRIAAHSDLVDSTEGGLLAGNQQEFTAALQELSDPQRRHFLSAAARRSIAKTYGTWDDCANRYHALYSKLLKEDAE